MKLLNECEGHTITVEMITGDLYRGLLMDAEDSMNMQMQDVVKTGKIKSFDIIVANNCVCIFIFVVTLLCSRVEVHDIVI